MKFYFVEVKSESVMRERFSIFIIFNCNRSVVCVCVSAMYLCVFCVYIHCMPVGYVYVFEKGITLHLIG